MQSCELVILISTLACSIAKNKSIDELNLLSTVFSQLGDTLSTIATNEDIINSNNDDNNDSDNNGDKNCNSNNDNL